MQVPKFCLKGVRKWRKNGNGEGTIYYSEKLKKWVGQFTAGRKDNGKLNRKSVYGNTRKEVKEKMTIKLAEVQEKTFIEKNNITVAEIVKEFLDNKAKMNIISPTTIKRNEYLYNTILKDNIANIELQKVTISSLQNFLNNQTEYSRSTIDKLHQVLNASFEYAIKEDIINKNSMKYVDKPKSLKDTKKVEAFTIEEQKLFVNELKRKKYNYCNIFYIALYTGMRVGEILALKKEDIDFDNNIIHIKRTLTKDANDKPVIGKTTKTYAGVRDIPITMLYKGFLEDSIVNYIPNKDNLIFCKCNGEPIIPSVINSTLKRICKNAGIKNSTYVFKRIKNEKETEINLKTSNVNTHMLRHTYATRCIEAGMQAVVLQKLLGHKSIDITLNTYTSVFNRFKDEEIMKYTNYISQLH